MGIRDGALKRTGFPGGIDVCEQSSKVLSNQKHLVQKVFVIRWTYADGTAETDTTFDLPSGAIVKDVLVNVITAEATGGTKTLDVGLLSSESGGNADGFLDGVSVASTGLVRGIATVTTGGSETYFASTTRGVMLSDFLAGTNTATDVGTYYEKTFLTDSVTAKSISITPGSNDHAELVADIYVVYEEFVAI